MSDSNSNLNDIVKSYLSTHDIYKQNNYRNSILLSVSNTNGTEFVQILDEIYEQNDDPADRQKVLKLLHEIISRTENSFNFVQVVQFLLKCLKLTLCVQLSVNTMKSLLTRHFNNEDFTVYESLQKFYNILLSKKMSQYPQQCRIDFLYISNFILDSYLYGKIEKPDVEMMCDAISGEKDPRNLLIMFDLLTKLAKQVAKDHKEFEYISNTYSIYYPIQFVPPKKDKIRITPLQLKRKLLRCFTSNVELAPFSIEILLDSLYSEFSVEDQHISIVSDTLYFLKKCKPLYGSQFKKFGKQLVEIIKSELLENNLDNKDKNTRDNNDYMDLDNNELKNKEVHEYDNNTRDNNINNMDLDNVSDILDNLSVNKSNGNYNKRIEKPNEKENKIMDLDEINKIGRAYYKEWKYVDEKEKLFSEILRLFLESMEDLDESELGRFMKMLKNTLYSNYSIGYMIDVLCENSKLHCSIVNYVVLQLLEDIYKGFVDAEILGKNKENNVDFKVKSEIDLDKFNQQREGILNILCMFIVPKILLHFKGDSVNEQLIVVLLRIIEMSNENSNTNNLNHENKENNELVHENNNSNNNNSSNKGNDIKQDNLKILKLLLLSSCIVNIDIIDKQINHIINIIFDNKDKNNSIKDTSNTCNNDIENKEVHENNNNTRDNNISSRRTEESMYLEILISIYKCHPDRCLEIVKLMDSFLNYDFKNNTYELVQSEDDRLHRFHEEYIDFREYIIRISYVRKNNRVSNVSMHILEMFKISLRRFLMHNNGYVDISLITKMILLSFSCLKYIISYKGLVNKDNNNSNTRNNKDNDSNKYTNIDIDNNKTNMNIRNEETQEDKELNTMDENIIDLCMTYSSLIAMLYEFADWNMGFQILRSIISSDRLLDYYYGLIDYYKRSFYVEDKESSFRLMFITSKVPRIISYLSRLISIDGLGFFGLKEFDGRLDKENKNKLDNISLDFLYLYTYVNNNNTNNEIENIEKDNNSINNNTAIIKDNDNVKECNRNGILKNKLNNELEMGLNLMNIEAYYIIKNFKNDDKNNSFQNINENKDNNNTNTRDNNDNDSNKYTNIVIDNNKKRDYTYNKDKENVFNNCNKLKDMFGFEYFNGSMLVKYVHEMYRFDFKNMIEQIKILNQYQVHNLEYDDLFFMVIPISLHKVRPILKYQMIDMRKLYKIKKKEIENKNNNIKDTSNENTNNEIENIEKSNNSNNNNNTAIIKDNDNADSSNTNRILKNKLNNIDDISPTSQTSLTEIIDDRTKEMRDRLLRMLIDKLRNEDYERIPSYYNKYGINNENLSKLELYVSFILVLLNRLIGFIEVEHFKVVLEEMTIMLDDVLLWIENNKEVHEYENNTRDNNSIDKQYNEVEKIKEEQNNNKKKIDITNEETQEDKEVNVIEVTEYIRWCCDKYLLYLQTLIFGVISNMNSGRYEIYERESIKDLFTKKLDMLIIDLVRIYKGNQVPFCRILSILCIHSIITSKYIHIEKNMKMKVIKTCSHFLGDPNKKVRGIAVYCRHQWINSMEE